MKLDNRTRALIAVGASITANCQPCLLATTSMALESGAGEHEIVEAIEMGKMVRKCAAYKMDQFAISLPCDVASRAGVPDEGRGCRS